MTIAENMASLVGKRIVDASYVKNEPFIKMLFDDGTIAIITQERTCIKVLKPSELSLESKLNAELITRAEYAIAVEQRDQKQKARAAAAKREQRARIRNFFDGLSDQKI